MKRVSLVAVLVSLMLPLVAPATAAAALGADARCQKHLGISVRRLSGTVLQGVVRCHTARILGRIPPGIDCNRVDRLPSSAHALVTRAAERLAAAATRFCTDAGASAPATLGYATCPAPCGTVAITNYNGLAACMSCMTETVTGKAAQTVIGSGLPTRTACTRGVGSAASRAVRSVLRERLICALRTAQGREPDASADCQSADLRGRIQKALARAATRVAGCTTAEIAELGACGTDIPAQQSCVKQAARLGSDALYRLVYPVPPMRPADLVLRGGRFYTVDPTHPWAQAVAVRGGRIVYVGDAQGAARYVGPGTRSVDLHGGMAMPGFQDVHMHLLEASHQTAGQCILQPGTAAEASVPELKLCSRGNFGTEWVVGAGHSLFDVLDTSRPPNEIMDDAIPVRPAVMLEETSHSVWVNSEALRRAGFNASSANPPAGVILKDAVTGKPNGILLDGAGEMVMDLAFTPNPDLDFFNDEAIDYGMRLANQNGITSVADARVYWRRNHLKAYQRAQAAGRLGARMTLGLWAYPYLDDDTQIATLASFFSDEPGSRLRVAQIKIYSDGILHNTTAALIEPYVGATFAGPTGLNYFDQARLTKYIAALEPLGFDFHIHAIGDRGVREALNAIEAARNTNCPSGTCGFRMPRHRITHVEFVHPDDIPRFAQLGVTADFQMSSEFADSGHRNDNLPYVDKARLQERWLRLRSLYDSGARIVLSSDWDVGSVSPFVGIQRSLTRGTQSLPNLDAAIRAYTINAAYVLRQENETGSIKVGKRADLVVLDRDLFRIPLRQISATRVQMTFLGGQEVYRAAGFRP